MPIHANLNAIVEGGACSAGPASRSSRSSRSSLEQQPEEASLLIGKWTTKMLSGLVMELMVGRGRPGHLEQLNSKQVWLRAGQAFQINPGSKTPY